MIVDTLFFNDGSVTPVNKEDYSVNKNLLTFLRNQIYFESYISSILLTVLEIHRFRKGNFSSFISTMREAQAQSLFW